ncbi:bifunctional 3-(3-hydroxy-phenyl)propionate/3-hydroxycinnamic acid hydroxylase [Mycobacterium vicinigordonae]|uniref:Bifunctional 3-(3-hydroxy-phenyl)propionate/3-hydroxycinnamic acid hydroxylase n=1 Tax=Mycobacterium vicinigordonae TaxID=1719132 RepID=A0A7D6HXF4_9MYCO|nr:bifunctional 3-(3-hydroxy-phenyl)propionate/3-hydroxycinnamic acid hydroxylase [Mycobacterium vicinigordonae]
MDCDVAVVGYGPVGATAANLLGRYGLKVIVIERDPDIYQRARAISTDEEVMRIWQSVGLADRLQQDMLADRPLAFVDSTGAPFYQTTITGRGCGHPPQQFIYQPAVDAVLRAGVARFAGVEVLLEHECLRVLNKGDHVELMLADLRADTFRRIRASYVIAADGGSSPTRGQLGVGYSGKTYSERWVVIDTKLLKKWDAHDRLRFHCNPVRPTVDCPTPLGHHRWEYPARAGEDDNHLVSDAAVWEVLNDQGITDEHVEILRTVIYRHHVRVADRWRVGRVFLAGDAAHAMPPWIGQGMAAGVRDVANLCWKLTAVLAGHAPESLLDSYEAERKPHVTEVTRRAVLMGRVITERNKVLATIRNHVLRVLTKSAAIRRQGQKLYWIPEAYYPDGFFAGSGHKAEGRQIIQPWVIDDTGARKRLDDVMQGRWTLLHIGDLPPEAHAWTQRGATSIPVRDTTLTAWLRDKKATAAIVRPDGFIYAATDSVTPLAAPPAGLDCNPTPVTVAGALAPTLNGVLA